jgi:hypothetical protein
MPVVDFRVTLYLFRAVKVPKGPTVTIVSLIEVILLFKEDRVLSIKDFNNKLY